MPTVKEPTIKDTKPIEDMYLLDEPVKMGRKLDEAKEFLLDIGEDPREYTNEQLLHMLEEGF